MSDVSHPSPLHLSINTLYNESFHYSNGTAGIDINQTGRLMPKPLGFEVLCFCSSLELELKLKMTI